MKWSFSAHTTMRRCQRQFVFAQIIAHHNARDPHRREAFILRQLQELSTWQGSLVHAVLATDALAALRAGLPLDPAQLTAAGRELARRQLAFSSARRYRQPGQTKASAGDAYAVLVEHEHGREISADALAAVDSTLARCFKNLAGQEDFLRLLRAGFGYAAEIPLSFSLNGITIAATLDLAFSRRGGRPTVVDWKVAESETSDYSRQLLVYALVVARCGRWGGVAAEDIELYEVNLLKNHVQRHAMSTERLDEALDFTYRSAVELEALVGDETQHTLDLNDFDVAEQPMTCLHCSFRPLCSAQLEAAGHAKDGDVAYGRQR